MQQENATTSNLALAAAVILSAILTFALCVVVGMFARTTAYATGETYTISGTVEKASVETAGIQKFYTVVVSTDEELPDKSHQMILKTEFDYENAKGLVGQHRTFEIDDIGHISSVL